MTAKLINMLAHLSDREIAERIIDFGFRDYAIKNSSSAEKMARAKRVRKVLKKYAKTRRIK
jgi:hypothetical protein